MTISLDHKELLRLHKTGIFNSTASFIELETAIKQYTKKLSVDESKDIKGAAFEIFGEFLLKKLGESTQLGVYDVITTSEDKYYVGTDYYGTGLDGQPFQIQAKFKTDYRLKLQFDDLGTFFTRAFAEATAIKNLLILTNVNHSDENSAIHYSIDNVFRAANQHVRVFGRDQIINTTSYKRFWDDFHTAIKQSLPSPNKRVYLDPNNFQLKALSAAISNETRLQILMPTGSGKTLVECLLADDCINSGGEIVVVVAPRIALVSQLCSVFQAQTKTTWEPIIISSGEKETREIYYEQDHDGYIEPSTKSEDITNNIVNGLSKGSVIIFTTNQSASKLNTIISGLHKTINLGIGDEAHNFTSDDFRQILDPTILAVDKWRFFTATRRIDPTGTGRGMNNEEYFGQVAYRVSPAEVIKAGLIVPPRLQYVKYDPEVDFNFNPNDEEEYRVEMAMMVAGIEKHIETMDNKAMRVIVFCSGAAEAHRFAKSDVVAERFPNTYAAAITADKVTDDRIEYRSNRSKRSKIFNKFTSANHAILFHYDVVSEGIDLPGATAILPLRPLGDIKATQGVGRALRVIQIDRDNLKNGLIKVGDSTGWEKPFGYVILPYVSKHNEDDMTRIERIVFSLRDNGYDFDRERLQVNYKPKSGGEFEPEFDLYPLIDAVEDPDMLTVGDIEDIEDKIDQELEDEKIAMEVARISHLSEEDLLTELLGE